MSRSNYSDDCDGWALIRWRGAVNSAIKGRRGQQLLRELRDALDAMPVKELISEALKTDTGQYCALGVVGEARGIDMTEIDPHESGQVAKVFGIADALAREIAFQNDEGRGYWSSESPAQRWQRMRKWVDEHIIDEEPQ